jgi:predicted site-specific integrase-resolvase
MGRIGYARVSTLDQNPELQTRALKAAGCDRIFTDHGVSGSKDSREQLDKMLEHLRKGDEVVPNAHPGRNGGRQGKGATERQAAQIVQDPTEASSDIA